MTFWEWIILLCTAPLWAPFAFLGAALLFEFIAMGCIATVALAVAVVKACRK